MDRRPALNNAQLSELNLRQAQEAPLRKRIAELEAELTWYGDQARLARLIHSEGDAGRNALAADGGKRAREVLTKSN